MREKYRRETYHYNSQSDFYCICQHTISQTVPLYLLMGCVFSQWHDKLLENSDQKWTVKYCLICSFFLFVSGPWISADISYLWKTREGVLYLLLTSSICSYLSPQNCSTFIQLVIYWNARPSQKIKLNFLSVAWDFLVCLNLEILKFSCLFESSPHSETLRL